MAWTAERDWKDDVCRTRRSCYSPPNTWICSTPWRRTPDAMERTTGHADAFMLPTYTMTEMRARPAGVRGARNNARLVRRKPAQKAATPTPGNNGGRMNVRAARTRSPSASSSRGLISPFAPPCALRRPSSAGEEQVRASESPVRARAGARTPDGKGTHCASTRAWWRTCPTPTTLPSPTTNLNDPCPSWSRRPVLIPRVYLRIGRRRRHSTPRPCLDEVLVLEPDSVTVQPLSVVSAPLGRGTWDVGRGCDKRDAVARRRGSASRPRGCLRVLSCPGRSFCADGGRA